MRLQSDTIWFAGMIAGVRKALFSPKAAQEEPRADAGVTPETA